MFDLIRELCQVNAPTGRETAMCALLSQKAAGFTAAEDAFGNFVIHKAGTGKRLLVSAPMDEPSLIVTRTSECFSYFEPIGSQPVSVFTGKRVCVGNQIGAVGICPVHLCSGEKIVYPKVESLYFQTARPCERGDFGVLYAPYEEYGLDHALIRGKAVCDRTAMAVMLRLLTARTECDLYLVFASRGRAGAAGVKAAAERLHPETAILLQPFAAEDPLCVTDPPRIAVPFLDSGAVHHRDLVELANTIASHLGVVSTPPKARQTAPASAVSQLAGGIRTLMLSLPAAYSGTVSETCRKKDAEALFSMLSAIAGNPAV